MVEETKDTKVLNMEEKMADKVEKMQQFLADNKIECFDVQKLEDERHTTIVRSRMEVKGQLLPMAVLMDVSMLFCKYRLHRRLLMKQSLLN